MTTDSTTIGKLSKYITDKTGEVVHIEYTPPFGLHTVYHDIGNLRKPSVPIRRINDELNTIIEGMLFLVKQYHGLGISGPQVGENINLFVLADGQVFINPTILRKEGSLEYEVESCLSIPGYSLKVGRQRRVLVHWYDQMGVEHEKMFRGKTARVIQHEYDHLKGILIDDYEPDKKRDENDIRGSAETNRARK